MKILVTGASGFVASKIVGDCLVKGHTIICCVRSVKNNVFETSNVTTIEFDFNAEFDEQFWVDALTGVDIIINCAGYLRGLSKQKIWNVHYHTPKKIFTVAKKVGVKKIIQMSALGVDQNGTEFANSKNACDQFLLSLDIPCSIVRPSLVYGVGSYGGASLFRGLSALKYIPLVQGGNQLLQPISVGDVSKAVQQLLDKEQMSSEILPLVGPEKLPVKTIIAKLRAWMGWGKQRVINFPMKICVVFCRVFDALNFPVINSTALKMLQHDNVTDDENQKKVYELLQIIPDTMQNYLLKNPSRVQDRWHAKLYFIRVILRISVSFVWLSSAINSLLLFPVDQSYHLLSSVGVTAQFQPSVFYSAIALDFILGIMTLFNYRIKASALIQSFVVVMYSVIIAIYLPEWWVHPFGPMIKNIPFLACILTLYSLESNR